MLGQLGYEVTLCPFDFGMSQFWTTVAVDANQAAPGTVTAVHCSAILAATAIRLKGWTSATCR